MSASIIAISWWTSFSNCVILRVRHIIPCRWRFCLITAAANTGVVPGCHVGDRILDHARARVLMAGDATLAATVASCARVLIRGLLPVVLALLCSHAMRHF